jgi:hypothetical protein
VVSPSRPVSRARDPLKQLAAYHLSIDGVFWSIRNGKNLAYSQPEIREIAVWEAFRKLPQGRFFVRIPPETGLLDQE